ncbi:MAG: universal stress protein [Planctomycetes bacterium]|nr:universal stress protein [Planctomycetota bacterium]MCB9885436.1 universal stress protein [Planctomycetota bacterium]
MPKELCIATDLSPAGAPAVQLGLDWARRLRARVLLLHVVHDPELTPALANDVPGEVAAARAQLEQLAATVAGTECRVEVRTAEDVAAAIVKLAAHADYLFVGSRGRSGIERLALGSVATAVLRHSTVPVVCVPAGD